MHIWELTPVDPLDPDWEASSHQGRVVVRANSEEDARDAAEKAFGLKTRFPPGGGVKAPPWKRPALVRADIIRDARFEEAGPVEVLFPAV
ncbi:MAG: hypothetical protein JSU82_15005 [Rhodospirillales bacterium]|nr:MAG: hypothetical protein JSU82_15005 [Rhodospirillales bacterium]